MFDDSWPGKIDFMDDDERRRSLCPIIATSVCNLPLKVKVQWKIKGKGASGFLLTVYSYMITNLLKPFY